MVVFTYADTKIEKMTSISNARAARLRAPAPRARSCRPSQAAPNTYRTAVYGPQNPGSGLPARAPHRAATAIFTHFHFFSPHHDVEQLLRYERGVARRLDRGSGPPTGIV